MQKVYILILSTQVLLAMQPAVNPIKQEAKALEDSIKRLQILTTTIDQGLIVTPQVTQQLNLAQIDCINRYAVLFDKNRNRNGLSQATQHKLSKLYQKVMDAQ